MSNKNKFLKKSLGVIGSSVATVGSLFSAAGAQNVSANLAETGFKKALSSSWWYFILRSLNFWGVFLGKIEEIKKEKLEEIIEDVIKDKFHPDQEVSSSLEGDPCGVGEFKGAFKTKGGNVYACCYDDRTGVYRLLSVGKMSMGVVRIFSKKDSKLKDIKKFYNTLIDVCYADKYREVCNEFTEFLKGQSKVENGGLFGVVCSDFVPKFNCFMNGNKVNSVHICYKGEKVEDVYVYCYYGRSGKIRGYTAGIEEMTKAEMVGHLESIMKQANEKLKKREESNSVNRNDIAGEN